MQIRDAEQDIKPLVVDYHHVKSHQDNKDDYDDLEDDAKLNTQCDILCNEQLERMEKENRLPRFNTFPACPVYLEIHNGMVNANEQKLLRESIGREELTQYYREKYKWSQATYNQINWEEFGRARRRNETTKRYITELCCRWLPTNYRMNMSEGISPKCPLCAETETNDHLFSCLGRSEWRTKLYQDLFSLLTKQHTAPLLKKVIIQGLRWQYEQHEPEFDLEIEHQTRIGWTHLVRGWIDKGWQTYQANYLRMHFPDDKKVQDTGKD